MSPINFFKLFKNSSKPIVIIGTGRSGTTWLAQIISSAGLEFHFESMAWMNFPKDYKLPCEPTPLHYYIRKGETNPYKKYMDYVMSGKIRNKKVLRGNEGLERKVIKLIHANLMVDWLQDNYDAYYIFLIRNPLAVVSSQEEFNMNLKLKHITDFYPKKVLNLFNKNQREIIDNIKNRKELLTVNWCIQNSIPLKFADKKKLKIIKYENLAKKPISTIKYLSNYANFKYSKEVKNSIGKKSFMSRKETLNKNNYNPLTDWKNKLTKSEVNRIIKIVTKFDLERYLDL